MDKAPRHFTALVDRVIPMVAELLLTLKMGDPLHVDVSELADRTLFEFLQVLHEKEHLTNGEIAMLIGRSASAFYEKKRRLEDTLATQAPGSIRQVYDYIVDKTEASTTAPVREWQLCDGLPDLPADRLSSVLRYLVRYGLLTASREGYNREYRLAPRDLTTESAYYDLMLLLYRDGPLDIADMAEKLGLSEERCQRYLARLREQGQLSVTSTEGGPKPATGPGDAAGPM